MKQPITRRIIAIAAVLCLVTGLTGTAAATQPEAATYSALAPLMDLVACAALTAGDEPEAVGNEETTMTPAFIASFFNCGLTAEPALGFTADMLASAEQQSGVLGKIFAAKLPALEPIAQTTPINGYIGFQPVTYTALGDGAVQIVGELYWGVKAIAQMTSAELKEAQWLDRAVYSFRQDAGALNGYRLTGFSVGSELSMEEAMQTYTESILVEYINTTLGFSVLYPSVFTDDMLVEDGDGVSAALPDNSVRFFVKRADNTDAADLNSYISVIAGGIPGASSSVNATFSYGTVAYDTAEGYSVFDMYIITDKYIYQAELAFRTELAAQWEMYTAYLENSFAVDEVSVG